MPAPNTFADDRSAMVNAFFAEQDATLVERLRARVQERATKDALQHASGIQDEALLQKLMDLDINARTLALLQFIPLIEVAWADGRMDPPERKAILRAAADDGLVGDTDARELLEGWLDRRPTPELLSTWMQYTRDISSTLDQAEREKLMHALLDRARGVAESAGGFLGMGTKVSKEEEDMLDRLAEAF
jgi:uncharacterized tellurite resistance protein B-like protein